MKHEPGDLSDTHFLNMSIFGRREQLMGTVELYLNMAQTVSAILVANIAWHFISNYKIVKK